MKKRENLVDQFSSFVHLDDVRDSLDKGWDNSAKLHRNMDARLQSYQDAKEEYWAKQILMESLEDCQSISVSHLCAYLEEVCYWTTVKICRELAEYQLRRVDCFLIGREITFQPNKLFKRYDGQRSRVKTYAPLPLRDYILAEVQRGKQQDSYSPMGLLRSLSFIQLETVLKKAGISQPEFSQYVLVLRCFKEKYVPQKAAGCKTLQSPNTQQLDAIALYYNESRQPQLKALTGTEVNDYLEKCVQLVRNAKVRTVPFDNLSPNWEEIIKPYHPIELPTEEEEQEHTELNQILSQLFAQLPEEMQRVFELVYGLDINQGDLVTFVGVKDQYQVSRILKKSKQTLLTSFAQWSQEHWKITLTSQQLANLVKLLDSWLKQQCSIRFTCLLQSTLLETYSREILILQLIFGQQLSLTEVAGMIELSESQIQAKIKEIEAKLNEHIKIDIETRCSFDLTSIKSGSKKVASFVNLYLQQAPYALFYSSNDLYP
jgi:RNA polymerase sigma factor (sigma-70 family)